MYSDSLKHPGDLISLDPYHQTQNLPTSFFSNLLNENEQDDDDDDDTRDFLHYSPMKQETKQNTSTGSLTNHQNGFPGINFSLAPSRFLPQITENDHLRDMSQNTSNLVHHMSLPKTSSEMAAFLHFQRDSSLPWKTRAKRGFATHPRSIAERVRRTRISERIKRLQQLFPDMDKQTNTADMLDMAVEYIKDLQKQLQTLNDARARCTCSSKQLQSASPMNIKDITTIKRQNMKS